ncbi:hypothetical protein ACFL67_03570 [candidate division KSB1 bacterium]
MFNLPNLILTSIFLLLAAINGLFLILKKSNLLTRYLRFIWVLFLILLIADNVSFRLSTWFWGFLCFFILREFFSVIHFRMEDRFGIIGAYLSVPFMMHYIHTDWYGMFIISIPVYSFLVVPFLISLGGKNFKGSISSIGIIDFGLFLFVYCIGHIVYLSFFNIWMAAVLIMNIVICDLISLFAAKRRFSRIGMLLFRMLFPIHATIGITILFSQLCGLSMIHAVVIGALIPAIVYIGNFTIDYLEQDLGIMKENLKPGRGLMMGHVKSFLYAAPIIFHYYRYFILI